MRSLKFEIQISLQDAFSINPPVNPCPGSWSPLTSTPSLTQFSVRHCTKKTGEVPNLMSNKKRWKSRSEIMFIHSKTEKAKITKLFTGVIKQQGTSLKSFIEVKFKLWDARELAVKGILK